LDKTSILSNIKNLKITKIDDTVTPEMLDAGMFYDVDDGSIPDEISYVELDFENDEYNFLIQIDMKIRDMHVAGQLTPEECYIVEKLSDGNSYKEVARDLELGKNSVRKIFNSTCNKLAFALGGVFTDEGYVEYMKDKHGLTEIEISKMITLMESNRRL
jgi:DNA-binding CsgD family transcriptional regulator